MVGHSPDLQMSWEVDHIAILTPTKFLAEAARHKCPQDSIEEMIAYVLFYCVYDLMILMFV